jgi:hypothetical protein
VLEGGGKPCAATLQTIKSRCDSVYVVHLLGALETALRGDYVQAPVVVVLASGMDRTPGLKDNDILKLARKNNVRIHALSLGYLANNDQAQSLLKRISGQFEEGAVSGLYQVADPQSGSYQAEVEEFLSTVLTRGGGGRAALDKTASLSSEGEPAVPNTEGGMPPVQRLLFSAFWARLHAVDPDWGWGARADRADSGLSDAQAGSTAASTRSAPPTACPSCPSATYPHSAPIGHSLPARHAGGAAFTFAGAHHPWPRPR